MLNFKRREDDSIPWLNAHRAIRRTLHIRDADVVIQSQYPRHGTAGQSKDLALKSQ